MATLINARKTEIIAHESAVIPTSSLPGRPEGLIEDGDFVMDLNSRSVTVRSHELHLNRAEFDVLLFLMSHRKRLVTSGTRLATRAREGVHQSEFLPALLSLRKNLQEEAPSAHYIRTEAWVCYEFQPDTRAPERDSEPGR